MALSSVLSSVNLIAAASIQGGTGGNVPIAANVAAVTSIANYDSLGVVSQFANVKLSGNSQLSTDTEITLSNLASNSFPALVNSVPSAYISSLGNTTVSGFTGVLSNEINTIMGFGDLGKFEQMFTLSDAFVISTNLLINSAINANNSISNATYVSQDNTITGGLSQISEAFVPFGDDMLALGYAINLANLTNLGSPEALLQQIYSTTGGNSELNTALLNAGIDQAILNNLGSIAMTDEQQKIVFDVMSNIKGAALLQILRLLKVNTRGIATLADLLNPVKIFPNSFYTMTAPTVNGLRAIYVNNSGTVNSSLETELPPNVLAPLRGYSTVRNTYIQLKNIIPPDWALANKALQAGFEQVKSIFTSTLPALGSAVRELESNKGLNLINALTSPLPAETSSYFSSIANGTGVDGTFLLADLIGTAGGWNVTDNVTNVVTILNSMTSSGTLTTLTNNTTGVFTVMQNVIDGVYGDIANSITIPGGLPGAGTYTDGNVAFTGPGTPGDGLIPAATTLINAIIANNSSYVTSANSAWGNIASQIVLEQDSRSQANIVYANLIAGTQLTSLSTSPGQYGTETAIGGAAWMLESVANVSTIGGQAIISSMREARNQVRLQNAGVQTDIFVNGDGVEPQISLSSGQYTATEAQARLIL